MKISEIIDKLEAYHGPLEPERRTCDIVQYGDPDQICTASSHKRFTTGNFEFMNAK